MIDKAKAFLASAWDWAKRAFGRSKIIFANVMGGIVEAWVMLYDPISAFDWDSVVDKHDVALAIGIGLSIINVILRNWFSDGPASFKALPPVQEVIPDENGLERSPKAN